MDNLLITRFADTLTEGYRPSLEKGTEGPLEAGKEENVWKVKAMQRDVISLFQQKVKENEAFQDLQQTQKLRDEQKRMIKLLKMCQE
ncbi:hypothetical protein Tco_0072425 [Tanacetum coccineum]